MKVLFLIMTMFLFGCQTYQIGDVGSDPSISSSEVTFDPVGSDTGNLALKTVFFPYDSSILSPSAQEILRNNAKWIKDTGTTVELEGHCDTRGSTEYNLALGERRALAVKRFLTQLGVPSRHMTTISYGKEKILLGGNNEQAHSRNRRVNFVPIKK